jgi:hypothetical protein
MPIMLRGGHTATDPRLGRVPQPDRRNAAYPIADVLPEGGDVTKKLWGLRSVKRLDQGDTPTCVGHGWAHRGNANPHERNLRERDALDLYTLAQANDEWAGSDYEGTSVLGGAKAAQIRNLISVYRWATTLQDVLLAASHVGPVVAGTTWYERMFDPDEDGYLTVSGRAAGGHCWMIRGVDPDRQRVQMTNSWGRAWGKNGDAYIRFTDLERLLQDDDVEFCIPTET